MSQFDWTFDEKADKKFQKLDVMVQRRIVTWLNKNITNSIDPRLFGKALEGEFQTLWRYRVGKYRIIADIKDDKFLVLVVKAGKRNDVYQKRK